MKKLSFIMSLVLLSIGLLGCQQSNNEKVDNKVNASQTLETKAEVIEGDFVYRLVSEKTEYSKNEPIKIYAELEYTGDKEEIEIAHSASPFSFPMVETTRDYGIDYNMNEPLLSTKLIKGEPLREEYRGSGGYGSEDKQEYKDFMKQIMNLEFPEGHYVVNGIANFYIINDEESEQVKKYYITAQVEFMVKK